MTKQSLIGFTLLCICLSFAGCDSTNQTTQVQDIAELRWEADGSALFGFIQSYTQTLTSVIPGIGYDIAKFGTDGSLTKTFTLDPKSVADYSTSLFLSSDGNTAVTQLEGDLYRYSLKTGSLEKLQQLFHLIVVSPDLHYAVGSPSPAIQHFKTIIVYDITASPLRIVTQFDLPKLVASSGIWLANGMFGITYSDSIGNHVSIFDTTGALRQTIGGAEILFHNVVYNPQTNDLFFRNRAGAFTDGSVDKVNLTTLVRTNVLKDSVDNFDVTRDENVIIYSKYDGNEELISKNLQTGNTLQIANDIRLIITLSPAEDRLAYIRKRDDHFNEVHVIPFTRP
ncbi:MAG: hypothetical protein ACHQM6_01820 [Candidatus Kapaibacterium sp.]